MKTCKTCGKPLETEAPYQLGLTVQRLSPCLCDCQKAELDKEEANSREEAKERRRVARVFPSSLYGTMTFEGAARSDTLVKAWRFCQGFTVIRPTGCGLLFRGASGGGKTFAAACIANELSKGGSRALFLSVPELCKPGSWDSDPVEHIKGLDLLILDDMGAERGTEYAQDTLFRAVDAAYGVGVPMIVTTNSEEFQGRAWSRVLDRCQIVEVQGMRCGNGGLDVVREVIGL